MKDFSEQYYDIYVTVSIEFQVDEKSKEVVFSEVLDKLKSIFVCFNVELLEKSISFYDGRKKMIPEPFFEHFNATAILCFDNLLYTDLQITERAFRNIIDFWNDYLFRRNSKEAFFRMSVYKCGERP